MFNEILSWFKTGSATGNRLRTYLVQQRSYKVYIGVPLEKPQKWAAIHTLDGHMLIDSSGQRYLLNGIRAFIVAYSNGEILDAVRPFSPWPADIHSIQPAEEQRTDVISREEFEAGQRYMTVTYGTSPVKRHDKKYYSTTLCNVSNHKVRVVKFAGYRRIGKDSFQLHTITGDYFTAEEFMNWYGQHQEWMQPGESVCDLQNYGGPSTLWVYFCQTETGETFTTGEIGP